MLYRKSPKAKECIVQSNISDQTMSETRVVNGFMCLGRCGLYMYCLDFTETIRMCMGGWMDLCTLKQKENHYKYVNAEKNHPTPL